jgi:hypothetical protein
VSGGGGNVQAYYGSARLYGARLPFLHDLPATAKTFCLYGFLVAICRCAGTDFTGKVENFVCENLRSTETASRFLACKNGAIIAGIAADKNPIFFPPKFPVLNTCGRQNFRHIFFQGKTAGVVVEPK